MLRRMAGCRHQRGVVALEGMWRADAAALRQAQDGYRDQLTVPSGTPCAIRHPGIGGSAEISEIQPSNTRQNHTGTQVGAAAIAAPKCHIWRPWFFQGL